MKSLSNKCNQFLVASITFYIYAHFRSSLSASIKPIQWSENIGSRITPKDILETILTETSFVSASISVYSDDAAQQQPDSNQHHYSLKQQDEFLKINGRDCTMKGVDTSISVHTAFAYLSNTSPSNAADLFKFCVLQYELSKQNVTVARFVNTESIILHKNDLLSNARNTAVVNAKKNMTHGALLIVRKEQVDLLKRMTQFIVDHMEAIEFDDPFLSSKHFYDLVHEQIANDPESWKILPLVCDADGLRYGCQVQTEQNQMSTITKEIQTRTILLTPYHYLPYQTMSEINIDLDDVDKDKEKELSFVTTMTERTIPTNEVSSPNFFQVLSSKGCLPPNRICEACMKDIRGGSCAKCHKFCGCFCDFLCNAGTDVDVDNKVVKKHVEYKVPKFKRTTRNFVKGQHSNSQVGKMIPNIVHQTWFEAITKEKYPNFSRLTESWKQTGWDYRFYNDQDAQTFLSAHFPSEIREAYESLLPGAFKADLFRYCVLFVHGGVYADVDVLLESRLDEAIDDDVGFMTGLDAVPGRESGNQVCLWNGFLAAAPGHPFLAAVIETVVNNVRNRFTSLDVMNTMCPEVDFFLTHRYDILFTTGPCILGASVNRFLGRHPQTSFKSNSTDLILDHINNKDKIPGRVVILDAKKKDMGCQRFTHVEKNLIIAATDMPDYDDRDAVRGHNSAHNHYSKLRVSGQIYGTSKLYKDQKVAGEAIKFVAV